MTMELTYEIARAAGFDAANTSMRKAGRSVWNVDDWNAMAREMGRLIDIIDEHAMATIAKATGD